MACTNEPWRRKMVVQNIPEDWSLDMLENFMEVVTKAALEDNGVEYFLAISHTVLLTFTEPLTDQHIHDAEFENSRKGKPLQFSLIKGAPSSILIRDLNPTLTHDNLFYYFDSPRAGGAEGAVEDCDMHADHKLAIVTFTSHEVASGVLAMQHHQPCKGKSVYIEPCYDQFHKWLLQDLTESPVSSQPIHPRNSPGTGWSADPQRPVPVHNASSKPSAQPKSFIQPKQQSAQHKPQSVPSKPEPKVSKFHGSGESDVPQNAYSYWRQKADSKSHPQQNQSAGWRGESSEDMAHYHGGHRGRGRKKKRGGRGRGWYDSKEESNQQRKCFAEVENQLNRGGRGGRPYKNRYPQSLPARGRGQGQSRGAWTSQSQEAEMMSFGPAHENVRTSLAEAPAQLSAPCRVIKLDADCDPIPQDASSPTNTSGLSSPLSATREALAFESDLQADGQANVEFSTDSFFDQQDAGECDSYQTFSVDSDFFPGPHDTHQLSEPTPFKTMPDVKSKLTHVLPKTETLANKPECSSILQIASENNPEMESKAEKLRKERLEVEKQQQEIMEQQLSQQRLEKSAIEQEKQQALEKARQLEAQLQQVKKECANLKNRRKWTEPFPPYKLRLMHDFNERCGSCEISVHEMEGTVEFHGTEDDYGAAKLAFLLELQELAEDSISIPAAITSILQTPQGKQYLDQLQPVDRPVSFDVQDSCLVCVAHRMNIVQASLAEVKRNIQQIKCKVDKNATAELQALKQKLEKDLPLVRLDLPTGSSGELTVDGLNGDFELAVRELEDIYSKNQPSKNIFEISGPLETKACKLWCTQELDDVKNLIWKNNGEVNVTDDPRQPVFKMNYQCRKDLLQEVQKRLDDIRKVTKVYKVNLKSELKSYSEQCLVINGLHNMGIEPFCRLLEDKLKKKGGWESIISFSLPPKRTLPKLSYTATKQHAPRQLRPKTRIVAPLQTRQVGHRHHHRSNSIRPFSTNVGRSTFTVKSGDIAVENVDGLVCVVGEDMDFQQTAVGQSVLKQYPQVAQIMPQRVVPQLARTQGQVITKAIPQGLGQQAPSTLHLAVLTKVLQQNLQANMKLIVQRCLQSAVQQGNRSVAFPPLGVGRKFQFPADAVANAMLTTAYQFLQSNPGTLQSVTFVVYDTHVARQFRETARKMIHPPMPAFLGLPQQHSDSGSDQEDSDDDNDDDIIPLASYDDKANSGSDGSDSDSLSFFNLEDDEDPAPSPFVMMAAAAPLPRTTSHGNFEACMCLGNSQDLTAVRSGLLQELRSTFVCEDIVDDMRTFGKLGPKTMDEIKSIALKKDVVLSVQPRGGKQILVVRGQQVGVTELVALIKEKLYAHQHQAHKEERRHKQRVGGLPSASDRVKLPAYWTICQTGLFKSIEEWIRDHRKYGKLHKVTDNSENQEILMLVKQTWDRQFVGHGKDGANLGHSQLQVSTVERLENPNLWEMYCTHRERLIRRLEQEQHGQAFTPVERLKGSSKAVRTTSILNRHSRLSREMFPQVNEHYLFHGTKKEYIEAIITQGLDTRIASEKAMLGRGVYASESSTKADQYTDDKHKRTNGNKTMILMRVLLGEPYINKNGNPPKYQRPPCKSCYQDKCQCKAPSNFDSVIDDAGRNFREFVVYERCMCYPEYFITYQRV